MKKKEWLCCVSLSASTATAVASHASSSPSLSLRSTTALRGGETEVNAPDSNHSSTHEPKESHNNNHHHHKKKKSKKKTPSTSSSTTTNTTSSSSSSASSTRQQQLLQDILKQEDFYQILGLTRQDGQHPDADAKIQKAYRRRAVVTHPDKTQGDRRAFDKVAEAYQVLSDPEQRQMYNRYGKAGLQQQQQQQQQQGGMPYDIFQQFFNHARPFNNHHPINRTTRYQITVSLEELYHGITKTILVPPPNASPFHETHHHAKHVSVHIPPGTEAGHVVLCSGEIDFVPDATPADLVLVVQQQRHDVFTRKHYDLAMSLSISWSEALGGFQRRIRHLNGKEIPIAVAGSIQSGDVYRLCGYGMPKTGTEFGDLYIEFEVLLPQHRNQLTEEEYKELKRLVHKMEGTKPAHIENPLELTRAKRSEFGVASGVPPDDTRHRYEEEQEEPHPFFYHAQGTNPFFGMRQGPMFEEDSNVQCRQM